MLRTTLAGPQEATSLSARRVEVVDGGLESGGVVFEETKSAVARIAEQASDFASGVSMVDSKAGRVTDRSLVADSTNPILGGQHGLKLFRCDPVLFEPRLPLGSGSGLPIVGSLVFIPTSFLIGVGLNSESFSIRLFSDFVDTTPFITSFFANLDRSALPTGRCSRSLVDVGENVLPCTRVFSSPRKATSPSNARARVLKNGSPRTALRTCCRSSNRVNLGQVMVHLSRRVALDVSLGFSFDSADSSVGLSSDRCRKSTTALAQASWVDPLRSVHARSLQLTSEDV